jgi:polysaccharide export outer membrane protein
MAGLLALVSAACGSFGVPMPDIADEINATLPADGYRIREGDRLDVRFPFRPEWNHEVTVRGDGRASFLSSGELRVVGLTAGELERRLSQQEEGATVNLTSGSEAVETTRAVFVIGEVRSPGPIRFQNIRLSLIEALATAGGPLKETANLGHVYLVRTLPEGTRLTWRIDAREEHWSGRPILLTEGDILAVPNTTIDDVDIWVNQYIRLMLPFPWLMSPQVFTGT